MSLYLGGRRDGRAVDTSNMLLVRACIWGGGEGRGENCRAGDIYVGSGDFGLLFLDWRKAYVSAFP